MEISDICERRKMWKYMIDCLRNYMFPLPSCSKFSWVAMDFHFWVGDGRIDDQIQVVRPYNDKIIKLVVVLIIASNKKGCHVN